LLSLPTSDAHVPYAHALPPSVRPRVAFDVDIDVAFMPHSHILTHDVHALDTHTRAFDIPPTGRHAHTLDPYTGRTP
jgi:hypothetical protein